MKDFYIALEQNENVEINFADNAGTSIFVKYDSENEIIVCVPDKLNRSFSIKLSIQKNKFVVTGDGGIATIERK